MRLAVCIFLIMLFDHLSVPPPTGFMWWLFIIGVVWAVMQDLKELFRN